MRPIDSSSQEQVMPEVLIRQERQVSTQARGLLRTFSALRHRNYRLFFFGQMISQIGTWMQTTAQAWLVLELTHSALLLGLVVVLQYLPVMMFSLFGGVLADRVPKRTLLLVTQSVALVQAAILWILVVTGTVQIWHIMLLAARQPCTVSNWHGLPLTVVGQSPINQSGVTRGFSGTYSCTYCILPMFKRNRKGKSMSTTHSHMALLVMDVQGGIVTRVARLGDVLTPIRAARSLPLVPQPSQ